MENINLTVVLHNFSKKFCNINKKISQFKAPDSTTRLIAQLWNIDVAWPLATAALSALADNLPTDRYWLRADPICLQVDLVHIYLLGNAHLQLQVEEIQAYRDLLNSYLQDQQMQLVTPHPRRWYLALDKMPDIHTYEPDIILGHAIDNYLLSGNERVRWLQLFNELQMLLYTSSLNKQRAEHGLPSVDALWFWGEGNLPQNLSAKFVKIFSNMPLASGLAKMSKIPCENIIMDFNHLIVQCNQGGDYLICVDFAELPTERNAEELLQEWFNTLQMALKRRQISRIAFYPGDGYGYCLVKRDWWRRTAGIDYSNYSSGNI